MTATVPFVSIIVPCRNELHYLAPCLDSILATEYPLDRLEILIVDGESNDGTRAIADLYAKRRTATVRVLRNPGRTAPTALNIGIGEAQGDLIARMDAHASYPPEYLPRLVQALGAMGADNVGGVLVTLPANHGPVARAIAVALSHPFGVGNSQFRIGATTRQWVDTVAFGCWPRKVFTWIGGFDEELVRNQDDEFNHRLVARGGRVLLDPSVTARYYARETLGQVARMFYQYGLYKPLVARKVGRVMTARQLAPPAFTLTLGLALALAPWLEIARLAGAAVTGVYALAALGAAAGRLSQLGVRAAAILAIVFPVMHLSYGWGFLRGLVRWARPARDRSTAAPVPVAPLSR